MDNKKKRKSILFIIISAIVILAMALLFFIMMHKPKKYLAIYSEAGYFITKYELDKEGLFSVSFTHSVNKSPVTDFYKIKGNDIYLYRTIYYQYGAGQPTDLEHGETLTYGKDGSMIIDGVDKKIDNLTIFLSDQSDHILTVINKKAYSLWHDCGKNVTVKFRIED